jgi:hypothetical protein
MFANHTNKKIVNWISMNLKLIVSTLEIAYNTPVM